MPFAIKEKYKLLYTYVSLYKEHLPKVPPHCLFRKRDGSLENGKTRVQVVFSEEDCFSGFFFFGGGEQI